MKMKISALFLSMLAATALLTAGETSETATKGPDHECTSWMIFSDLTGNNTNILHKNRDASSRTITVVTGSRGSRRWIALGTRWKGTFHTCMALNTSGLAVAMNSGEPTHESTQVLKWKNGRGTALLAGDLIAGCDTAAQAVEMLKGFIEKKDYSHKKKGSIFFFTDPKEG